MSTCLDDGGEDEVRRFILHLQGEDRPAGGQASSHTVNNRVRALRAFFNWLYGQGYAECHRLEKLKAPKARQKEIETLTDKEIGANLCQHESQHCLWERGIRPYTP